MNDVLKKLSLIGIVPVIKIDDAANAVPLAKALIDGGLPCAEVTFRTSAAKDSISAISKAFPDMLVGAGTVLTKEQVDDAIGAGAKFIVSPGLNPEVVSYCVEKGYPMIPGISNPSGIEQALSLGLDTVKFFPAEQAGGLEMIKAMSAPYGSVRFMPTGGVNPSNLAAYLSNPKIICCGGSWMVKADIIAAKDFDKITRLAREAVGIMLGFELAHVGINCKDERDAESCTDVFATLFSLPKDERTSSALFDTGFEILKSAGRGKNGHIAIYTSSVERAVYHLEGRGVRFDYDTVGYTPSGAMKVIYLKDEVGGFAVHLLLKK